MAEKTSIEWTDATWNPIRGCSRVSEGCRNCYAEGIAARFSGARRAYEGLAQMTTSGPRWTGEVRLIEDHLQDPLRWKSPRRIFVNSMSDLFHESIPDEWVDRIFAVMALAPQHTFQVLTKRAERLPGYFSQIHHCGPYTDVITRIAAHTETIAPIRLRKLWPLPNVQLGVSVEDQKTADERIPHLLNTPAAVRFISAEPLLGPIDVERYLDPTGFQCIDPDCVHRYLKFVDEDDYETTSDNDPICRDCGQVGTWTGYERGVDWVIVGGESGHSARPMHPQWARGLRDQCDAAGVSFFFKQWGEYRPFTQAEVDDLSTPGRLVDAYCECGYYCDEAVGHVDHGAFPMRRVGKKKAGRLLDGRTWDEFPNTTEQHDS